MVEEFVGLAAARQLDAFGYKVIIIEGHGRPGGRVYTKQLKVQLFCHACKPIMHHCFLQTLAGASADFIIASVQPAAAAWHACDLLPTSHQSKRL